LKRKLSDLKRSGWNNGHTQRHSSFSCFYFSYSSSSCINCSIPLMLILWFCGAIDRLFSRFPGDYHHEFKRAFLSGQTNNWLVRSVAAGPQPFRPSLPFPSLLRLNCPCIDFSTTSTQNTEHPSLVTSSNLGVQATTPSPYFLAPVYHNRPLAFVNPCVTIIHTDRNSPSSNKYNSTLDIGC
jgi:hypothetical protein